MSINLKETSTDQLKALAYDLLNQQRFILNNLQIIEQEINLRAQKPEEEKVESN